jgi:hypothetical protein
MDTTTIQTKDRAETNARPLRIFHPAFTALVIPRDGLYYRLIGGRHLYHD